MIPPFRAPLLAASLMPSDVEHTNENIFKAMNKLRFPVLASRKIDGVRGLRFNGTLLSRRLKRIPNNFIRNIAMIMPGGFDVEICNEAWSYNDNESVIMSESHPDEELINFHVIDWYAEGCYTSRMLKVEEMTGRLLPSFIRFEFPFLCQNAEQLLEYLLKVEEEDGEGVCFRDPQGLYVQKAGKENRSTLKEQTLVKFARFIREEAVIVGFEEQMNNCNAKGQDAFGKMKRSKAIGGMKGKGTLGALVCETFFETAIDGTITSSNIRVATGLTDQLRYQIWTHQKDFLGHTIVFKHKPYGKKDKPRSPIWVGFRKD